MKKVITAIALIVLTAAGFSQQDQQFSQFMYNKLSFNPGYAGTTGSICFTGMYRNQWMGFPGNPKNILFNFDAPVRALHGGAGLTIIHDQLGNDQSIFARGAYAYHQSIGSVGVLGIGLGVGVIQKSLKFDWTPPDGQNSVVPDASIPDNKISSLTYDLDFGLFYSTPTMYVGLAATHLPEQNLKKNAATTSKLDFGVARHYFVQAGYTFNVTSEIKLIPHVLAKSDAKSTIFDINLTAMYDNMVWLGASFRMTDAVVAMAGYQKEFGKNNLRIGLAYDFTLSDIKNHSDGTPEVFVGYCIKIEPKLKTQLHINPRFLK
jgi:type IX secretion system PorP/SprF family membrane protein